MKVSVVIPVYNAAGTLDKCLDALYNCAYKDFEVIIVLDGSEDNSANIAEQYPCRIESLRKNSGPAAARNRGAELASGDILFFIDSDVKVKRDAISLVDKTFRRNPEINIIQGVYSDKIKYKNVATQYQQSFYAFYAWHLCDKYVSTLTTGCFAIRKNTFLHNGGFNEDIKRATAEDEEFGYKLIAAGNKIMLLKELEAEHMAEYSLGKFLKRGFFMSAATMKSYLRNRTYVQKMQQSNYSRVLLSLPLLTLIIFSFIVASLYPSRAAVVSFFILNVFFVFLHLPFWIFIAGNNGFGMVLGSAILTYADIFLMGAGAVFGCLEFAFGKRY